MRPRERDQRFDLLVRRLADDLRCSAVILKQDRSRRKREHAELMELTAAVLLQRYAKWFKEAKRDKRRSNPLPSSKLPYWVIGLTSSGPCCTAATGRSKPQGAQRGGPRTPLAVVTSRSSKSPYRQARRHGGRHETKNKMERVFRHPRSTARPAGTQRHVHPHLADCGARTPPAPAEQSAAAAANERRTAMSGAGSAARPGEP